MSRHPYAFEEAFAAAVAAGVLEHDDRDGFHEFWRRGNNCALDDAAELYDDLRNVLSSEAPPQTFSREDDTLLAVREDGETMTLEAPPPPELEGDEVTLALDAEVRAFAAEHEVDYVLALGRMAGDEKLIAEAIAEAPPAADPELAEHMDPERVALDRRARESMGPLEVSYFDALEVVEAADAVAEASRPLERSDVPWLDLGKRVSPPRPWEPADFEVDKRRAQRADVDVPEEIWRAAAEQGRDIVHELAVARRADKIDAAKGTYERRVEAAQQKEARRRDEARRRTFARQAKQPGSGEHSTPRAFDVRQDPYRGDGLGVRNF